MPPTQPTELTALDVDRVDAVDRPATRRKFLIVKDEGGDGGKPAGDPVAEAKRLLSAASAALSKVHAHKAEYDDQGIVDALNELAIASGAEQRFNKSAAPVVADPAPAVAVPAVPPAATGAPVAPVVTPAPAVAAPQPVAASAPAAAIDMTALASAVGEAVVKALKADIDKDADAVGTADDVPFTLAPDPAPPSAQPAPTAAAIAKAGPRKMGDGMFTNVVFGQGRN